jgi:hypothetical protein
VEIFLYLFFSAVVGFLGRHTRVGPWAVFILSLILSPPLVLCGVIVLGPRDPPAPKS